MTPGLLFLVGLAVLVAYAPRVAKRIARERRDAIERHSRDRGEGT